MGAAPVDRRVVEAIAVLDAARLPYAEIRRLVAPLARRLGAPVPAYTTIRRLALTERAVVDAEAEAVERVVAKLLQGRVPTPFELAAVREARQHSELVRTLAQEQVI